MKSRFVTTLLLTFLWSFTYAQNNLPGSFQDKLESMQMTFMEPLENRLKIKKQGKTEYFRYDLRLKGNDSDIFVILDKENYKTSPHIRFASLCATIATNNQDYAIETNVPDEGEGVGEDWSLVSRMAPKKGISRYDKVLIRSVYKENLGTATIIYCFKGEEEMLPPLLRFMVEH